MATATATKLTLAEFLALPETEPASEFICGEVIQKPSRTVWGSQMVVGLIMALDPFLRATGHGRLTMNVLHADRDEERAYLPDVGVISRHRVLSREERRVGPL